jgi:abortive infection bacteriophage resistance protein
LKRLVSRGLVVNDPDTATRYLTHIGYYRLSGYTRPFQKDTSGQGTSDFKPGSTFEDVLDRYVFDRKLRLLVMDAVERIEVSTRAALSNVIATLHGDPTGIKMPAGLTQPWGTAPFWKISKVK